MKNNRPQGELFTAQIIHAAERQLSASPVGGPHPTLSHIVQTLSRSSCAHAMGPLGSVLVRRLSLRGGGVELKLAHADDLRSGERLQQGVHERIGLDGPAGFLAFALGPLV